MQLLRAGKSLTDAPFGAAERKYCAPRPGRRCEAGRGLPRRCVEAERTQRTAALEACRGLPWHGACAWVATEGLLVDSRSSYRGTRRGFMISAVACCASRFRTASCPGTCGLPARSFAP